MGAFPSPAEFILGPRFARTRGSAHQVNEQSRLRAPFFPFPAAAAMGCLSQNASFPRPATPIDFDGSTERTSADCLPWPNIPSIKADIRHLTIRSRTGLSLPATDGSGSTLIRFRAEES